MKSQTPNSNQIEVRNSFNLSLKFIVALTIFYIISNLTLNAATVCSIDIINLLN